MEVDSGLSDFKSERINPYAPPEGLDASETAGASQGESLTPADRRCLRVGRVVVTWEKLRILYNAILAAETLFFMVLDTRSYCFADIAFFGSLADSLEIAFSGFLIANVFFCLGPFIDGYLSWFGLRSRWITWLLFLMGMVISMLFAFIAFMNLDF